MKKKFKSVVSMALAIVILFSSAPLSGLTGLDLIGLFEFKAEAFDSVNVKTNNEPDALFETESVEIAESSIIDSGSFETFTWSLNSVGVLEISGIGAITGNYYYNDAEPWSAHKDKIKRIIFHEGITSIAPYMFYNYDSLISIDFPNTLKSIKNTAFEHCSLLQEVIIPDSVTSISYHAFRDCEKISKVKLSNNLYELESGIFYNCDNLRELYIPATVKIYNYSSTNTPFRGSTGYIQKIVITAGTNGVMQDFGYDSSSTSVYFAYAPWAGNSPREIVIEEGVKTIGSKAFAAGQASYSENPLTTLTLPGSLTTVKAGAFSGCTNIKTINYTGDLSSWCRKNFIGSIMCSALEYLYIDGNLIKNSLTIPENVNEISAYAFYRCDELTNIYIPIGTKTIEEYAFYMCSKISDVYYAGSEEEWAAISLSSTGNSCLTNATIHYNHTHNYIQNVIIPATCLSEGESEMRCECGNVSEIIVTPITDCAPSEWIVAKEPTCFDDGISIKKCTFCDEELERMSIEATGHTDGKWKITTNPTTSAEGEKTLYCATCNEPIKTAPVAILDPVCDYLKWQVNDDNTVTITDCDSAYSGEITIPASIYEFPVTSIAEAAFAGSDITGVTIPEGVETIGECAFAYCENLKAVNIPASVSKLGETAFVGSTNIEKIDIPADNESYATDEYGVIYNKDFTLLIYAPAKSVGEAYTMRSTTATACELSFADCTDFALTLSDGFSVDSSSMFFDILSVTGFVTGNSCVNYKAIDGVLYNKAVTTLIKYPVDSKRELLIPPASVEYVADEYAFVTPEVEKSVIALFGLDYDSNTFNNMYREPEYLTVHIDSFYDFDSDSLVFLMMGPSHVCFGDTTKSENDQLNEIADNAIANIESQWEEKKDELTPGSIEYYYNEAFVLGYVDLITSYIDCQNDHTRLHKYAQVVETKDPTCAVDGYVNYDCDCGYEFTDVITAPGHDYESVITEPTCTEKGFTTHTCSVCGDTYTDSEVKENGHSYESVVTKVTCTTDGYTTHTCSVCKDTYTDSVVKAEGHKYDSVVTPNTCTKDGYTTHTCSVCEDTYTDSETKATGHSHESKVTKEPTCTNTGIRTFTCHCGDSYTEVIKANGHTKGEWKYIGGKEYAKSCTVCGDKLESKIVTVDMFFNGENVNKKQVLNKSTATVTATVTDNFVNDLVFASSDNSTVSVDANGNVVANNIGKATITVTIKGTAISDSIEVEVLPRDFTVTWNVNGKHTKQTVKEEAKFTPNVNTTLKGYKFIGWDKTVPTTMPAENLTFTAQYELIVKELKIKNPSVTTINYGETLVMHADFGGVELPEGWTIQWTVEGAGFNMAPAADGLTCKMTSVANGNATVKATLVDENGEAVLDEDGNEMSDSKQLTSKAGFFQKFVSFFKNLFGISRIILQSI